MPIEDLRPGDPHGPDEQQAAAAGRDARSHRHGRHCPQHDITYAGQHQPRPHPAAGMTTPAWSLTGACSAEHPGR